MPRIQWDFCKVRLCDLIEWAENPQVMLVAEAEAVRDSLAIFGVAESFVVNADRVHLISGTHRKRILMVEEGPEYEVWALYPDRELSDEEAHELAIRLNGNHGHLDPESMLNIYEISQIETMGVDMAPYRMIVDPVHNAATLAADAAKPPIRRERSGLRRLLLMLTPEQYDEVSQKITAAMDEHGEYEGNPNADANAAYWLLVRDIDE